MSRDDRRVGSLAVRRAAALAIAILIVDQLTKRLVVASIDPGEVRTILPFLDLVYVRNEGVAFSSFSGKPWIVGALVGVALIALTIWFARNRNVRYAWIAAGMLAGGAVGNILDRLTVGHVIDFLKPPSFPAFNVADSSIVVGMGVLVLAMELDHRRNTRRAGEGASPAVKSK
ncbi:MAG: signal peptidase II [Patulibacter sp.]|nr:signal peptidase II [Patulibacter sp.]MBF6620950.1 signal peptidase II [Patulibacter sp.]